jgi:AraC family transcriptional regulator of adaptative response/methylated-DNA-[protein]-cysteine methyltransferase
LFRKTIIVFEGQLSIPFMLHNSSIQTPIGTMIASADESALHFLAFTEDKVRLEDSSTTNPILKSIKQELAAYFSGELFKFETPIYTTGTNFQKLTLEALLQVPYGATISYKEQATNMNMPNSYRAVANANGANRISVVIPCHRIIHASRKLGGYRGGIAKKQWLIEHERKHCKT